MFELVNPTTFKYYLPFTIIYATLFAISFIAKAVIAKQKDKRTRKLFRKSFSTFLSSCFWVSLFGFLFLAARHYRVAFLSMEFLHVLNGIILAIFLGFGIKKYMKLDKKMK